MKIGRIVCEPRFCEEKGWGVLQYSETYRDMSDDEVLNVAVEVSSLEDQARIAIALELSRRGLSGNDVIQYRQHVAAFKPEDFWGTDEYTARSMNGCGVLLYGKRDFQPDDSFVTTKWFAAFFVPLLPLGSMRVKTVERGIFSSRYLVLQRTPSHSKQVVCVYGYLFLLAVIAAKGDLLPIMATVLLLGIIMPLPWLLRKIARARASRATKRISTLPLT